MTLCSRLIAKYHQADQRRLYTGLRTPLPHKLGTRSNTVNVNIADPVEHVCATDFGELE